MITMTMNIVMMMMMMMMMIKLTFLSFMKVIKDAGPRKHKLKKS